MVLDPRRNAHRPDLADARLEGQVVAARFVAGKMQRVIAPSTALRRAPVDSAPLDTEALHGEHVVVFERREDGWCWVQLQRDGYVGYVLGSDLTDPGAPATHRVIVPRSFVYPLADIKAPPLSWLPLGAEIAGRIHDDRFLALDDGGFIIARHAGDIAASAPDFVAVAESFLAVPYLWGGKTGLGLDCSGLVQIALSAAGVPAPRDSDMQAAELGQRVNDFSALRRGDLVFWPGHVGVMRDAATLLHANGHHMQVASEKLADAVARIELRASSPITAVRRVVSTT
jgi:cell wall-associated NlpC family hydrolase